MSQNTPNKTHRTGMGSNLDQERKEVCKQELIIVETYTSFNLHNAYYIITIPITIFYILILTYLLTPWSRVLLEKLAGLQLVKKFPAFYGTRRFLTAHTSALHLSLSWARPIQSSYPNPTSWRSTLILSFHLRLGLPNGLFPSGFPTSTLYTPLTSPITEFSKEGKDLQQPDFKKRKTQQCCCSTWPWSISIRRS